MPRNERHATSTTADFRITRRISRRRFLIQAAAAGAAAGMAPLFLRVATAGLPASPSNMLNIASIGVGGMGANDLACVASHGGVRIAAICDVDSGSLHAAAKKHPGAILYNDWRVLLAREAKNIDAVTVSTPDHMHAPISVAAMNLGKHVYCQKPVAHDIYEVRRMMLVARARGVVTQMGIQCHSMIEYRMAAQMLQEGVIGRVKEVHVWAHSPSWPQGGHRPTRQDPVPSRLKWDNWLGVASPRPFTAGKYHPEIWRGFLDFGTGALGDMGCHIFDTPVRALRLGAPLAVRSEGPGVTDDMYPSWEIVHYEFAARPMTAGMVLPLTWYDGGRRPDVKLVPWQGKVNESKLPLGGAILVGEDGVMLLPHLGGPQLYPREKFKNYKRPRLSGLDHYHLWVDACRGKGKTSAGFDYAGPLTETVLLGALAARFPGQRLQWDSATMQFTNQPRANEFIKRRYRKGWEVCGLS